MERPCVFLPGPGLHQDCFCTDEPGSTKARQRSALDRALGFSIKPAVVILPRPLRRRSGRVGLGLQDLAAAVEAIGADVVTQMHFTSGGLDRGARVYQGIVRTVHATLGRRLLVLLNGHVFLLKASVIEACSSSALLTTPYAGFSKKPYKDLPTPPARYRCLGPNSQRMKSGKAC